MDPKTAFASLDYMVLPIRPFARFPLRPEDCPDPHFITPTLCCLGPLIGLSDYWLDTIHVQMHS